MQKKNKLEKIAIVVFAVACCVLFFVLEGKPAFSLPAEISEVETPLHDFTLTECFPEDKIEVFDNFIRYKAPCPIVDARLGLNEKVSYEDFLSAVSFALAASGNYRWLRATSFLENVLEPLSHDLKTKEFRGYRFPVDDLPAFFRSHAADVQKAYGRPVWHGNEFIMSRPRGQFPNPNEICMAGHYARTFWRIYNGLLSEAYSSFVNCPMKIFLHSPNLRFDRPHYFHSDEERYLWFLFLQAELRHFGHYAFADQIMEIELEHYRELVVWQLQKRAYLAQRFYEIRDYTSLSILKKLLMRELADLRRNDSLNLNFEEALGSLRSIDDKVRIETQPNAFNGVIVLPWINRQAIDRRMRRRDLYPSEHSINPFRLDIEPTEWRMIRESMEEENRMDDETKKTMIEVYGWILSYIRALAIANERLYAENSLEEMTQLHSKLENNRNVSYTEIDSKLQRWRTNRWRTNDDEQRKFDTRRRYIITRYFWHHQYRRQNGDMTVGDVILPWVEVRDDWF